MRKTLLSLAAVPVLLLSSITSADDSVMLRLNYQTGRIYHYLMTMNMDLGANLSMSPQPMEAQAKLVMGFDQHVVKETPGGGKEVELAFTSMAVDVTGPMMFSYDSENPEAGSMAGHPAMGALGNLKNIKYTIVLDKDNNPVEVKGIEEMMASMGVPTAHMNQEQLKELYSGEQYKSMMRFGQVFVPNRRVKVGETWKESLNLEGGNGTPPMELKAEAKFTGWEKRHGRKCAVVDVIYHLKMDMNKAIEEAMAQQGQGIPPGMEMDMKMDMKPIPIRMYFDPKLGQAIEMNFGMAVEMDVQTAQPNPSGGDPVVFNMDMDLSGEGNLELRRISKPKK